MSKSDFETVVQPVIEWLAKNHHPHTKIIIDGERAELVESIEATHQAQAGGEE